MRLLELNNLSCQHSEQQILHDITMHVDEGEVVSIIGDNQAGKTTLLQCISGLGELGSGEILFEGTPVHDLSPEKVVESGIIQVPEGGRLFSTMTVRENLEMGAYTTRSRKDLKMRMQKVYALMPFLEQCDRKPAAALSSYQQEMLAIGRALMARPKLLMIDEPSYGMPPTSTEALFRVISEIARQGITILITEQSLQYALYVSSRIYMVTNSTLVREVACGVGAKQMAA